MGRVIAVANQKGGVGKTTTAINLAASLAAAEVDCLLVDCDPQSNATSGVGLPKDPERLSTYHLLMGAADPADALQRTQLDQLWVIPSHKNLIGANIELVDAERREFRLRDALEPLRSLFQFIVLDCPPALDLLTLNALVAADAVLIPMQAEYFALEGVSELMDTVDRIRQVFNPDLGIEGVVLTMFDDRTNLAQAVAQELKNFFGDRLCSTTIPRNVKLAEAPSHGKPVLVYDVRSRGAESYIHLAKELLDRHGVVVHETQETAAETELVEGVGKEVAAAGPVVIADTVLADEIGAVDPEDEPLFAYFDPALMADAMAGEGIASAEIPAEIAVAQQFAGEQGTD